MADPVTLEMARLQCGIHVSDTSFDALLQMYIGPAVEFVENRTGHLLSRRSVTEAFRAFNPYLDLSKRPVISVTQVAYVDDAGTNQTITDAALAPMLGINPVRVYPADSWPTTKLNTPVTVTYVAGPDDADRPQSLVMACLLLIGHWWTNREAVAVGDVSHELQLTVDALCQQHRMVFI